MEASASPDYALLDRAGAGRFIFYPRRDLSPAPPDASDDLIEVEPGVAIGARFYPADASRPTLLYFHGNGEVAADHDGIAPLYHRSGLNLFVADFRGYGRSGGSPTFAALVADAHPVAARFHALLDEQGFSGVRFIMGRSLGSHPAIELAANQAERFRGLIIESGAANLRRLVTRIGTGTPGRESAALVDGHQRKLESIRLPTLILHGEYDELIPVEHAIELHEQLKAPEKDLVIIPGAGHNDILWLGMEEYFEAITTFVARHST